MDGILADLGVSSHQFDMAERGFSTRFDAELDMRMDRDSDLTAATVLEEYSKEELVRVFRQGTDIKHIPGLADAIIRARAEGVSQQSSLKPLSRIEHPTGRGLNS